MPKTVKCFLYQRYVPDYRVPLFDALERELEMHGIKLLVVAGPSGDLKLQRHDALAGSHTWLAGGRSRLLRLGSVSFQQITAPVRVSRRDIVVSELSSSFLQTYLRLLKSPKRTILWGHGGSFVSKAFKPEEYLEAFMCKVAGATVTYSEVGRASLLERGVPANKVTSIGNSTDTKVLREVIVRNSSAGHPDTSSASIAQRRRTATAMYAGALDASKSIDFMVAAAMRARQIDPEFVLLVAGEGNEKYRLQHGIENGYIVHHPRLSQVDLARLSLAASALWVPGRVGLIAVDALAMGLPVLTRENARHAPEVDFLDRPGELRFLTDDPGVYADEALKVMSRDELVLRDVEDLPSVEAVAQLFAGVIVNLARLYV